FEEVKKALPAKHPKGKLELIHSRFRPHERKPWREQFLNRAFGQDKNTDRIIVATQVVEAGVDISASLLITELAPWPSLVQRFGRCARYGGAGHVIVVNRGLEDKPALPYTAEQLDSAWKALEGLEDVSIAALEKYEDSLDADTRKQLYPYDPPHLLLRREFDELFDTTPDLTGAELDISRFIRSGNERDLQVFWREIEKDQTPAKTDQPQRDELCPVPFLKAQEWLCDGKNSKLRKDMRAWVWDWLDGAWSKATREALLPGRVVCVDAKCGGYSVDKGFSPSSEKSVTPVTEDTVTPDPTDMADAENDNDSLSASQWKTIACHAQEVADVADQVAKDVGLAEGLSKLLVLAARWHDVGKAHPVFQGTIRGNHRPPNQDLAKAPDDAWLKPFGTYRMADDGDSRPGFRHELASALALFALLERYKPDHPALLGPWSAVLEAMGVSPPVGSKERATKPTPLELAVLDLDAEQFNLLVYLVASHHGKVRVALHASPKDQDYVDRDGRGLPIRGVREDDTIPSIPLAAEESPLPKLPMTLEPAKLGLSPRTGASWRERTLDLLDRYGPTSLAYLEAILRAADVRASRLNTPDPTLNTEAVQ
ncbi:MAG: CRISPR-associated endonuclease Cas3'', partial [bacterium]